MFYFFFSVGIPFISSLISMARTSKSMLYSGEGGHPCFILDVRENVFSFSPLKIMFAMDFSLFSLMSLSILFVFLKNQLFVLLISAIVFFTYFTFIFALIFMISFLLLTLGFCCFSVCFRCKVRLFNVLLISCGRLV